MANDGLGRLQRLAGRNLKQARLAAGYSQERWAYEKLKISRSLIGEYERGTRNVSLQTLEDLAARAGLHPLFDLLHPDEEYLSEEQQHS